MRENPRYFLGYGERLTAPVSAPSGGGAPEPPYALGEAVDRLSERSAAAAGQLDQLPDAACPQGQAVGVLRMHPQAIAKSYFPAQLLSQFGLRHVGSRPVVVQPEKWTRKNEPQPMQTTDLFVAGDRQAFGRMAGRFGEFAELSAGGADIDAQLRAFSSKLPGEIQRIEDIRIAPASERLRSVDAAPAVARDRNERAFEVVLHATDTADDAFIVEGFADFAAELGVEAKLGKRLYAGGLCFIPVIAATDALPTLAQFSFLRVARPVAHLRGPIGIERSSPAPELSPSALPAEGPQIPDLRVAVFDGGLPDGHQFGRWATAHDPDGVGTPVPYLLGHGHDVTSAVLFGSLVPGAPAPRPYCHVDHFRVLDAEAGSDPFELYDVLGRIKAALQDRDYDFVNLSIGPAVPVEDDEVHAWSAVLDEHLADGRTFAAMAVGNTGEELEPRIQTPADCVNGVSVGAADTVKGGWKRAPYSSIGPGRSPGVVKPDILAFGGTQTESFLVYDANSTPAIARQAGTSFASPLALRSAVGLRAHFGSRLSPLAIKGLLIHAAEKSDQPRVEVGWGRIPLALDDIALCEDGMVRVIYQGELSPSQYMRAEIPIPAVTMKGNVEIRATFCYASAVDPEDPGNYTEAGLDITFRPHKDKFAKAGAVDPKPRPFFKSTSFDPEHALRGDAQKWETVLHQEQRMRGSSLKRPVFDIHYNAREGGGGARHAKPMRYALVIDVISARTPDLYDRVSNTFAGQLEALVPQFALPLRIDN